MTSLCKNGGEEAVWLRETSAGVNGTKCIPLTLYIMATAAFALTFNSKRSIGGRPSAGRVQRASRGDLMTAASVSSQQRRAQQLKRSDW